MSDVLMKCGHTANAVAYEEDGRQKPACVICNCTEIEDVRPSLVGRKAKCYYGGCSSVVESSFTLPFFEYNRDKQYDSYYCGCKGWD